MQNYSCWDFAQNRPDGRQLKYYFDCPCGGVLLTSETRLASQSPTSLVLWIPPRSGETKFSCTAAFTALFKAAASACHPRNSNIIALAKTEPSGLAIPLPAMFGAEP